MWMESGQETRQLENASFTFGYGARICLGKGIALTEVHKLIFQFPLNFRLESVDLDKHGPKVNIGNFFQRDMWVKVHARTPKPSS
ncbi:hypothetical protein BDZ91DRAFT_796717 [Kalaharituber pfeilii]|nr:hypothetical protein BDZ91DRAFT_796717 [Kalaharituber pfeilii]